MRDKTGTQNTRVGVRLRGHTIQNEQQKQDNYLVFSAPPAFHVFNVEFIGLSRYVLGVYNSNTKVMKMYDTEIVTLQPKVLGTLI